jgi:hypothetical protein
MENRNFFTPVLRTKKYWNIRTNENNIAHKIASDVRQVKSNIGFIIMNSEKFLAVLLCTAFLIILPIFVLRHQLQIIRQQLTSIPRIAADSSVTQSIQGR